MNTPWGKWEVLLEEPDYKVKRILVRLGCRLSYQTHTRRSEHWIVVKGIARVTLDGAARDLGVRETAEIPAGTAHRVQNPGTEPLVFIEIQTGDYFGEDDIVRLEDDYGRTTKR
jgi:mannose-6-phosphate isomerase